MSRKCDSHLRALAKATSWRLGGAAVTTSIAWTLSGEASFAASMGALDILLKFGCYYLHERVWDRIDFGRTRQSCANQEAGHSCLAGNDSQECLSSWTQ